MSTKNIHILRLLTSRAEGHNNSTLIIWPYPERPGYRAWDEVEASLVWGKDVREENVLFLTASFQPS